jgi:hypothetical protein
MHPGIESVEQGVVMRNDLFEAERACVCGHVAVADEDCVVPEANSAAYCSVNAVLRHASRDDELFDTAGGKFFLESSSEE